MNTSILAIALALFASGTVCAGSGAVAIPERTVAFRTEKIPQLTLKDATLQQAVSSVRSLWEQRHGEATFPVVIAPDLTMDRFASSSLLMSCDFKEIPYVEAIRYIGELFRVGVRTEGEIVMVGGTQPSFAEDLIIADYPLGKSSLAALGIADRPTSANLHAVLTRLGIEVRSPGVVVLTESAVVVRTSQENQKVLSALFLLLEKGYQVSK